MRSIFLSLALGLIVASPALAADPKDYLPIQPGSEWTLDATFVSPKGDKSTGTGRRQITDKVEQDGKTYHRTHTKLEGGPAPMEYRKLIRKDEAGLYSVAEGVSGAKEQLEIPLPLKVGLSWQTTAGPMTVTNTVVALETVTVGGKTYKDCFHIRTESADKAYREDYWEAPKVGNVKSEIAYGNGGKITLTLREFKAGK